MENEMAEEKELVEEEAAGELLVVEVTVQELLAEEEMVEEWMVNNRMDLTAVEDKNRKHTGVNSDVLHAYL
ncbi:hypothetical protein M569_16034 [Genlisea aurea]|uniref:Uncharacterized protein n=1 Tax=Genlisea aurea TaxID=192259 RepID=S8BWM7_9LAMI|nr:hypothetical protein M569_16034 [Genlisea aurea]